MSPSPKSRLVCTGFLTLGLGGCMQLPISKAALRLEENRAAANRTHIIAVATNMPLQSSGGGAATTTQGQGLATLHGYVFSSASNPRPESASPLVVFVEPAADADRTDPEDTPAQIPVARRSTEASAPTFVVTSPGQGVRFENTDDICHSFFSSSAPNAFDLGVLNPGESKLVSLDHEGFVQVYCTLHAGKQMSLLVAPTSLHALVNADGSFAIPDLRPGEYTLTAWGEGLQPRKLQVVVSLEEPQAVLVDLEPSDLSEAE